MYMYICLYRKREYRGVGLLECCFKTDVRLNLGPPVENHVTICMIFDIKMIVIYIWCNYAKKLICKQI